MKRYLSLFVLIIIAALIAPSSCFAELGIGSGGTSNPYLSVIPYEYSDLQVALTPLSETITVWHNYVSTEYGKIYVSKYNSAGTALWENINCGNIGTDNNNQTQSEVSIASDKGGGVFITHDDNPNSGTKGYIYLSHIYTDGVTHQYIDRLVSTECIVGYPAQSDPSVACNINGEVFLCWDNYHPKCAKVQYSGSGDVAWTYTGTDDYTTNNEKGSDPAVCEDINTGGAFLAYCNYYNPSGSGNDRDYIRVVKLSSSGSVIWTKDIDNVGGYSTPAICSDGMGGALIAWWYSFSSSYWQLNVTRIYADGSTWGSPASLVDNVNIGSNNYYKPSIASDGVGGALVTWNSAYDNSSYDRAKVQRVEGDGNIIRTGYNYNEDDPINAGNINQNYSPHNPTIAQDINGGAVVGFDGISSFTTARVQDVLPSSAYVAINGNDNDHQGQGTVTHPYKTVKKALMNIAAGGTVFLMGTGESETNILWPNKNNISLKSYTPSSNPMIIGNFTNRQISVLSPVTLTIEGVSLTKGKSTYNSPFPNAGYGGGIYLCSGSSLTLKNNFIAICNAGSAGGALYSSNSTVNISSVEIINCSSSSDAGAIFATSSVLNIDRSIFINNIATSSGGAMRLNGTTFNMKNSLLLRNSALYEGGAIYLRTGSANITNCTLAWNNNTTYGPISIAGSTGGWGGTSTASLTLKNSIVFDADRTKGAITLGSYSNLDISYSDLSSIAGLTSNSSGHIVVGALTGVVTYEPIFHSTTEPVALWVTNHTLEAGSPCMDIGTMDASVPTLDFLGQTRPRNRVDMGASEFQGPLIKLISQQDGATYQVFDPIVITWEASDSLYSLSPNINIRYSFDNGVSWSLVASVPATDGIYSWVNPGKAPSDQYKISIEASNTHSPVQSNYSASNQVFKVLQPTVYVSDSTGSDGYSGTINFPFKHIQRGLDAVANNGVVHVLAGKYKGTGNVKLSWPNKPNVVLRGAGTLETIISAEGLSLTDPAGNRCLNINYPVYASIESITMMDGYLWASLPTKNHGAGICITAEGADVTLNNVTLFGNHCFGASQDDSGAAVWSGKSTIHAIGCLFKNNASDYYGGAINGGTWEIESSTFDFNGAMTENGGAIASIESAVIRNSTFKDNYCSGKGGLIFNYGHPGTITIESSRFLRNYSNLEGGVFYGGNYNIINSVFMDNKSTGDHGGVMSRANADVHNSVFWLNGFSSSSTGTVAYYGSFTAKNSIFFSNRASCFYYVVPDLKWSDIQQDSFNPGPGNISLDPRFVSTVDTNINFMKPKSSSPASPCIDTGTIDAMCPLDIIGTVRPQPGNGRADMGIYEHIGTPQIHNNRGTDYFTIYAALNDARTGETITIDDGPYVENINYWPNIQDIKLKATGPSWDAVVVSGGSFGPVFNFTSTDPLIRGTIESITISSGLTTDAGGGISLPLNSSIEVVNCKISGNQAANGAGASNAKLRNCAIVGNTATLNGGGLYQGSAVNCLFKSNHATNGGGAYNSTTSNCSMESNQATSSGGGIYGGTAYKVNFYSNTATTTGGAVADASLVDKCRFFYNTALNGSAISMAQDDDSIVRNCLIVGSSSGSTFIKDQPTGVSRTSLLVNDTLYNANLLSRNGKLELKNSIVWGNSIITKESIVIATYCDITGGNEGIGNIDVDPSFIDTSSLNFGLNASSECIDNGIIAPDTPSDDIVDTLRNGTYDIGAYEYVASTVTLLTPNASTAQIEAGYPYTISWSVIDQWGNTSEAQRVILSYLIAGDTIWTPIVNGSIPSKSYIWSVPTSEYSGCNIKISIATTAGTILNTSISRTFEVSDTIPPTFTLKTSFPKFLGSGYEISWEANDIFPLSGSCVMLEFSPDFGATWSVLSPGLSKNGTYIFTPDPGASSPEGSCSIRFTVTDPNGNYTITTSDSFGIDTKAPTLTLTMPISYESSFVPVTVNAADDNDISYIRYLPGESAQAWEYFYGPNMSRTISINPPLAGIHVVTFEARDTGGNVTTETSTIEVILSPTPEITAVFIEEKDINTLSYLGNNPKVTAMITDYIGNLSDVKITVLADNNPYTFEATYVLMPNDLVHLIATAETNLAVTSGAIRIHIDATDNGNVGTYESATMTLSSAARIIDKAKTVPNPFSPSKGGTFTFIYRLSNNAQVKLLIYDLSGRPVWQRNFSAGSNGGRGPYDDNTVLWNGKSDFGDTLPNGVYIFMITSDTKVISKGQLTIID
jgi:hypothetical protein